MMMMVEAVAVVAGGVALQFNLNVLIYSRFSIFSVHIYVQIDSFRASEEQIGMWNVGEAKRVLW